MPRLETTTRMLYKFDELSDAAKENARQWWRDCENECSQGSECVFEDVETIAELFGLSINQNAVRLLNGNTRNEPKIYYSGFSSQGDGACFEGDYEYKKGALKAVKDYAPQDIRLHAIVERLQVVQRKYFYALTATTKQSGHYYHSGCMAVLVEGDLETYYDDLSDAENEVIEALRSFADWIYSQLEEEYYYRMSDENVDESIECNEYEFIEEGYRA